MSSLSSLFNLSQSPLILDGGLGTEFEKLGFDVKHPLWSAKLLRDNPGAVRNVHVSFFEAGAQCASTNTYQASIPGFMESFGLSPSMSAELLWKAVELANEARDIATRRYKEKQLSVSALVKEFDDGITTTSSDSNSKCMCEDDDLLLNDLHLKVSRSCGPYGAYLHDGSEYTGFYKNTTDNDIKEFHQSRLDVLRCDLPESDIICFETIPSRREALIIYELLKEYPDLKGRIWISFCCKDNAELRCGYPFNSMIIELITADQNEGFLSGVGLNCTEPNAAIECISSLQTINTTTKVKKQSLTLIAYPNSGEKWNSVDRCFIDTNEDPLLPAVPMLLNCGVRIIGGCCRISPDKISHIREQTRRWMRTKATVAGMERHS